MADKQVPRSRRWLRILTMFVLLWLLADDGLHYHRWEHSSFGIAIDVACALALLLLLVEFVQDRPRQG
jgi:hypothetical protein